MRQNAIGQVIIIYSTHLYGGQTSSGGRPDKASTSLEAAGSPEANVLVITIKPVTD